VTVYSQPVTPVYVATPPSPQVFQRKEGWRRRRRRRRRIYLPIKMRNKVYNRHM